MGLFIGLIALCCLVASFKGLYEESKIFRAIVDFLQAIYVITMVVWLIVEWFKYGWWEGAFFVLLIMGTPLAVCGFIWDFIPDKQGRDVRVKEAK